MDYFSDLAVVYMWLTQGQSLLAYIGLAFMSFSYATSLVGMAGFIFYETYWGPTSSFSLPARILLYIFLPLLGLHVFFMGMVMDHKNKNQTSIFYLGKAAEATFEALPMAILTIYSIVSSDSSFDSGKTFTILASSLVVSGISMAYGTAMTALEDNQIKGIGNALRMFIFCLVDIFCLLVAVGFAIHKGNRIVLFTVMGIQLAGAFYHLGRLYPSQRRDNWTWWEIAIMGVSALLPYTIFDMSPRNSFHPTHNFFVGPLALVRRLCILTLAVDAFVFQATPSPSTWAALVVIGLLHTYLSLKCFKLMGCMKFDVDSLFSCFSVLEKLFATTKQPSGMAFQLQPRRDKLHPCLQKLASLDTWSAEPVRIFVDMAESVLRCKDIKNSSTLSEAIEKLVHIVWERCKAEPQLEDDVQQLVDGASFILSLYEPNGLHDETLQQNIQLFIEKNTSEGLPPIFSRRQYSESQLVPNSGMDSAQSAAFTVGHISPQDVNEKEESPYVFSTGVKTDCINMRALPLAHAANIWLWKDACGSAATYNLTIPAHTCNTFVSHSWSDNFFLKASMLRGHLFLLEYDFYHLTLWSIVFLQLIPVGFIVQAFTSVDENTTGMSWWIPLVISMGLCALLILRAHLSGIVLPTRLGPWPAASQECMGVWLDKCCIDQTSNATKQKGISHIGDYLQNCDTMTVMLGKSYFTRLWTTFELATFCKLHKDAGDLHEKLIFLSLQWNWTFRPLWLVKHVELSQWEQYQLLSYSCLDAQCYMPKDRAFVLATIRSLWGSEENFDQFVRTEMMEILRKGKERFVRRPISIVTGALDMLF